jgi:hypothetical protein
VNRAKQKFKVIEVTERDVKVGVQRDPFACPIARALKRAFRATEVSVGTSIADVDERRGLQLPKRAQNFIERFDEGKTMKPFSFRLRVA